MADNRLWTVEEIAEALRVGEEAVRRWCRDGKIRDAVKVGRRWLVKESTLSDFLGSRTRRPGGGE